MRTCSVKRPCIDKIYNVQVVLRVSPTPQRGKGMGKERGSQEGENLRDRDRGGSPSPWSLWLSPSFILTSVSTRIANPRSAIRQTELSVACQRWGSVAEQSPANYWGIVTLHLAPHHPNSKSLPQAEPHFPLFIFNLHYLSPLDTSKIIWYYNLNYSFKKNRSFSPFFYTYFNVFTDIL